jgi:hypothetical protein
MLRPTVASLSSAFFLLGLTALLPVSANEPAAEASPADNADAVPMVHVTDLYRPHNDPDDHWDLACAYALAWRKEARLLAVFIDHPQAGRGSDPDVLAVAQLNYLTGQAVPVIVGTSRWVEPAEATDPNTAAELRGVQALLRVLRNASQPVIISILGSCRDIAIAGQLEPELFRRKCAAVYLNAGSGTPDPEKARRLEWNVSLDPRAYSAIFDLPCPIYWMPCFEQIHPAADALFTEAKYGTYYRFHQGDILPHLSSSMQNFFDYVFLHGSQRARQDPTAALRPNWLRYLTGPVDSARQQQIGKLDRNMWCTGGFLHAVGKTVTTRGEIAPLTTAQNPIFSFDPIQVTCSPAGVTQWQAGASDPPRYIFRVHDPAVYSQAMTEALKSLVTTLP